VTHDGARSLGRPNRHHDVLVVAILDYQAGAVWLGNCMISITSLACFAFAMSDRRSAARAASVEPPCGDAVEKVSRRCCTPACWARESTSEWLDRLGCR
jgi:hypothetical protein